MRKYYDVVFLADPRFPGGTSTALVYEIKACIQAGISFSLLPVKGSILKKGWPFHSELEQLIADSQLDLVGPDDDLHCEFCIVHHPTLFETLPTHFLSVQCNKGILVLHHPLKDGNGAIQYDLDNILANTRHVLGVDMLLAPVGPLVREQFEGTPEEKLLTPMDWYNLIDCQDWPDLTEKSLGEPICIGRHSRPHPPKWPETRELAMLAYPDGKSTKISMLGASRKQLERVYKDIPDHWDLIEFGEVDPKAYLEQLDFFVYFHSPQWVEAFGRSILEAAACGLVCILPHHFEKLFGDAAIYCEENEVGTIINELISDQRRRQIQTRRARKKIDTKFGLKVFAKRLEKLAPDWFLILPARSSIETVPSVRTVKRVLFFTSNGVGLGHLTRCLAICEHFNEDIEPVFFTLSKGYNLAAEAGFRVEYRPFHRTTGAVNESWNNALAEELLDVISFYDIQTVVFDGNNPYSGLITALEIAENVKSIWVRRGFWNENHAKALRNSKYFDAILEPDDLSSPMDKGPTFHERANIHVIPPIVRGNIGDMHDKESALQHLQLDKLEKDKKLVLLSLGSGTNFDMTAVRKAIIDELIARDDTLILEVRSPLNIESDFDSFGGRVVKLEQYPLFPYLNAFDAAFCACGYNTFHEHMTAGLPTVFVPNEAGEMDLQFERAQYAALAGRCLVLRWHEDLIAHRAVEKILDQEKSSYMRERCKSIVSNNGAEEAARFISLYSWLRKTKKPNVEA